MFKIEFRWQSSKKAKLKPSFLPSFTIFSGPMISSNSRAMESQEIVLGTRVTSPQGLGTRIDCSLLVITDRCVVVPYYRGIFIEILTLP